MGRGSFCDCCSKWGVLAEELIEFARERLSGPKTPKVVIFVDELPKTGSGKVLKRELRNQVDLHIQSES